MKQVDSANFSTEVLNSSLPVVIDLYADWCGPCKMFAPVFEKLAGEYDGKVNFAKLDVDASQDIAAKYDVNSIPTFIIFKDGKEFDRKTGAGDAKTFKEFVNKCM